jgi:hypothetical protein
MIGHLGFGSRHRCTLVNVVVVLHISIGFYSNAIVRDWIVYQMGRTSLTFVPAVDMRRDWNLKRIFPNGFPRRTDLWLW